jgi:hypothetical protein
MTDRKQNLNHLKGLPQKMAHGKARSRPEGEVMELLEERQGG